MKPTPMGTPSSSWGDARIRLAGKRSADIPAQPSSTHLSCRSTSEASDAAPVCLLVEREYLFLERLKDGAAVVLGGVLGMVIARRMVECRRATLIALGVSSRGGSGRRWLSDGNRACPRRIAVHPVDHVRLLVVVRCEHHVVDDVLQRLNEPLLDEARFRGRFTLPLCPAPPSPP